MTWTYLSTAPTSSGLSHVRLLVGDTSSGDQLLSDEEISGLLAQYTGVYYRAAAAAEAIASKFARYPDRKLGQLSISQSQRPEWYLRMAARLRSQALDSGISPFAGGVSVASKDAYETDSDRVNPAFSVGMFDNPNTGASSS